jgi:crotonobetainyl-CoA:carnitine CoA-transferase CaiB-like acyl-CoA transferase
MPVKLTNHPASIRTPPPQLGEHTRSCLEEAGYTTAEVDRLLAAGDVVGLAPE